MLKGTCICAQSLQLCPTLCYPVDYSPPGSSAHGIFQAIILEWVTISSSRESSQSRDWTHISYVSCIGRWVLKKLQCLTIHKQKKCTIGFTPDFFFSFERELVHQQSSKHIWVYNVMWQWTHNVNNVHLEANISVNLYISG